MLSPQIELAAARPELAAGATLGTGAALGTGKVAAGAVTSLGAEADELCVLAGGASDD